MMIHSHALQPRPAGDVLSEGVRLGAATYRWYSPLFYLLTILYFMGLHFTAAALGDGTLYATIVMSFGNIFYSFILFAYVALLVLVPEDTANKDRRRMVRRPMLKLTAPILGAAVLFFVLFAGGTMLFIIPGLIAFIFFLLFPQVIAIESKTPFASLKRSAVLIKGSFFKAAGLYLIFLAAQAIAAVMIAMYLPLTDFYISALAGAAVHLLIVPFQAAVMTMLYMDTRADHEAFDAAVLNYEAKRLFRTDK
ncbi:hypothetical protein [Alteribacter natronophilus]|uniref:hypothetical protein n=1 Tax=Alteribacter natronophilus TaxID=2583810 RepID=UPI00110EB9F7|nr:hypothetical protein [Alteribacter natronophilus]TMW70683.1 hypothetical protein FGB90_15995 [Alteribacter natronophilus]